MNETWRPVVGWEGLYEVSDLGRVLSLDRIDAIGRLRRGKILALHPTVSGHLQVRLCRNAQDQKSQGVHVLVLEAFVGPRPRGHEACHFPDRDPGCNRLSNLRWDTRRENKLDQGRHGTDGMGSKTHCPRGHPLAEPNLVPSTKKKGYRQCLSCQRARSFIRRRGLPMTDLQKLSDQYLAALDTSTI